MNDLWRALRYLWKYWGTTLGAFLSLLIVTATNLFSPQLLRLVIDQGIAAQNLRVILFGSATILLITNWKLALVALLIIPAILGVFLFFLTKSALVSE